MKSSTSFDAPFAALPLTEHDLDQRLTEMARRFEDSIGAAMAPQALDALNARLDEIGSQIAKALAETPRGQSFEPLEKQISDMAQQLGRAEAQLPISYSATIAGINFRTQWITFDAGRTKLAAVSNALHHLVPLDGTTLKWPVARNWGTTFGTTKPAKSTGRPNGPNNSRSGNNETHYSLVTEWRHL